MQNTARQDRRFVFGKEKEKPMKKENNGSRPLREELNSSAVSEQNAAASSELANQAQILKELTEHFQVRNGTC